MSGIRIHGLVKRFGEVAAVQDVDLVVERGEFVTLLGPSGSGKTTTLRMVAGLEAPDAGTIAIGDKTVNGPGVYLPTHKRNIGMVFQSYAVWPHKTVYENVAFPLRMKNATRDDERGKVERMLELVGLPHGEYGGRFPAELSGGQQQRVALARALVGDPEVILYDEPLSNLDARLRDAMRVLLRRIHNQVGVTALYVTHDQLEAMVLSDRVCVMNFGAIVQTGTPRELYDRPASLFVAEFVGQANVLPAQPVAARSNRLRIGDGIEVEVASPPPGESAGELRFVIRHHHIRVLGDAGPSAPNQFAGTIREVLFLGDRMRYSIELASDCTVVAEILAEPDAPVVGARVRVALPADRCIVL